MAQPLQSVRCRTQKFGSFRSANSYSSSQWHKARSGNAGLMRNELCLFAYKRQALRTARLVASSDRLEDDSAVASCKFRSCAASATCCATPTSGRARKWATRYWRRNWVGMFGQSRCSVCRRKSAAAGMREVRCHTSTCWPWASLRTRVCRSSGRCQAPCTLLVQRIFLVPHRGETNDPAKML